MVFLYVFASDPQDILETDIDQTVVDASPFFPAVNELPAPQEAQMVTHRRHAHLQHGSQLLNTPLPIFQCVEELESSRVSHHFEMSPNGRDYTVGRQRFELCAHHAKISRAQEGRKRRAPPTPPRLWSRDSETLKNLIDPEAYQRRSRGRHKPSRQPCPTPRQESEEHHHRHKATDKRQVECNHKREGRGP